MCQMEVRVSRDIAIACVLVVFIVCFEAYAQVCLFCGHLFAVKETPESPYGLYLVMKHEINFQFLATLAPWLYAPLTFPLAPIRD